ncbi:hypothetical protein [Henriciella aquimarina]|uniref:hypothetical protein n=1 Tax=Henriciella aquimarina TaxID=545261 RepID=UPI00117ADF38|nr:hypothetical protein [Henriciella aquimarina]
MTQLSTFDTKNFPTIADTRLLGVRSCLIYYVTTGRNAWHSTWVQQYSNGCMHTSISSAKEYAERLRTQGTVFTIKQQPSIGLLTTSGAVFVTQINTTSPLSDYSEDALHDAPQDGAKLIDGAQNNYMKEGASTLGAILSFDRLSRFWRTPPPAKNSVIIITSEQIDVNIDPIEKEKLKAWSSYSNGSGYLLGWRERENNLSTNAIRKIAD